MFKKFWIFFVKLCGWNLKLPEKGSRKEFEHCVFVVAPHTSVLDFIFGAAYLWACCSNGKVLIKKEFFCGPLGSILKSLGAISVDRGNKKNGLVDYAVGMFNNNEHFSLALTPEATRKFVKNWKRGFWEIAANANVPIVPTYIDFKKKEIGAFDTIYPSDNYLADLQKIRSLYRKEMARHPDQFAEV